MSRLEKIEYPLLSQDLYKRVMDNGMVVYYIPKKGKVELSSILSVSFGSIDKKFTIDGRCVDNPSGIAHFLEHQVFESEASDDVGQLFTKIGAESNAYTSFDRTAYFVSTTQELVSALDILLDFTSDLHSVDESVDKEKGIIKQEIDMYADDPDARLYNGVLANLYPETALAEDVAGTVDSIKDIDLSLLRENFSAFYRPDFKTLIIVGDFDVRAVDRVVKKVETRRRKTLPKIERSPIVLLPVIEKSSMRMDVSASKLGIGLRSEMSDIYSVLERKIGIRLYMAMLFGWTSLRYQNWYDSGKIDDSFDIEIEMTEQYSFLVLVLDTDAPIAMGAQIRKVLSNRKNSQDINIAHLNLIKNEIYGEFIRSIDNVDELSHQFLQYLDSKYTYFDFPELLQKLDFNRVLEIGDDFFANSERTEFIIFPK